ncbi:hypothetical protein GCM10011346_24950 [Oceanobacillus neutriphilus]|uniref:Uncharacterized protein n=1 Tax=Oceanobacillus neutriphilus TaxID=531815 RepID=A0ABQ2NVR0_9BACI|nr:hypothetical protein GCM10011346_24950 [Oceanobacillus neutriphilus]
MHNLFYMVLKAIDSETTLFKYGISKIVEEIIKGAKTKYYHVANIKQIRDFYDYDWKLEFFKVVI